MLGSQVQVTATDAASCSCFDRCATFMFHRSWHHCEQLRCRPQHISLLCQQIFFLISKLEFFHKLFYKISPGYHFPKFPNGSKSFFQDKIVLYDFSIKVSVIAEATLNLSQKQYSYCNVVAGSSSDLLPPVRKPYSAVMIEAGSFSALLP